MTTRWRCSPRRNTMPADWPTLRASSGVITPLARPRMPSVPKYLRTMISPARRPPLRGVSQYHRADGFKKCEQSLRPAKHRARYLISPYFNRLGRAPAGGVGVLVASLVLRFWRLRDVDRVRPRDGFLQRLVQRAVPFLLDPAFLVLIAVSLPARVH